MKEQPKEITLQPASLDIWDSKYRLKDAKGNPVDADVKATHERVAAALSQVEKTKKLQQHWKQEFLWALDNGAIPAGRITSNAGALDHKPSTSTINCTVSGTIEDNLDDILTKVKEAGLTLKQGSGIGYCFSTIRPKGAFVAGSGSTTSGALSFMDVFDKMCFTIASAGGRRGAQMGTFDIQHPEVMDFIRAKREDGRLRQFNLSLLITSDFVEAVEKDQDWKLVFPMTHAEREVHDIDLCNPDQVIWRDWETNDNYIVDAEGLVACKVYQVVKARHLWNLIMSSTYDYAEPGFLLIDKVNQENNNWFCEDLRSSNPCGMC